jgi:hypothetical protein
MTLEDGERLWRLSRQRFAQKQKCRGKPDAAGGVL